MGHFKLLQGCLASKKRNAPSNLTSFTCHRRASSSAYLALVSTSTFQLPPSPTLMPGPRSATRDNLHISTYITQLSSPRTYQEVSTTSFFVIARRNGEEAICKREILNLKHQVLNNIKIQKPKIKMTNQKAKTLATPFLSLRGATTPKQSRGGDEIATPRQVGARNDTPVGENSRDTYQSGLLQIRYYVPRIPA